MTPRIITNTSAEDEFNNSRDVLLDFVRTICFFIMTFLQAFYRTFMPLSWQKKKELREKVVLITGAGGGIGNELARQLAVLGARLVLWDNNEQAVKATANACKDLGAETIIHVVDITNREIVYDLAQKIKTEFGAVDILINNAAITNAKNFSDLKDDHIDKLMEVNVKALFWTTKAFLPEMIKNGVGHLVCVSSASSIVGCPGLVDYSASKYAATGFMEALHHELLHEGQTGIKFTTICPMFVKTPLIEEFHIFDDRFPLLKAESVARKIVEAIQQEQQFVAIPNYVYWLIALKGIIPTNIFQYLVLRRRYRYG